MRLSANFVPYEEDEQRTLVDWLSWHKVDFIHVPNGGWRDWQTAKSLKRGGVKAGASDLLIFTTPPAKPQVRGVAIELKRRKGGRTSKQQRSFLQMLQHNGWVAEVCRGADEAIGLLAELGYGRS